MAGRVVTGPRLATVAEMAAALGVSRRTLYAWRRDGIGPRWVRIGPTLIRYDATDMARGSA